jgi:acetyltransferase-like isoleucine patch superfamily enzyme
MSSSKNTKQIRVGPGGEIDAGVRLGVRPGRKISDDRLVIGKEARLRTGTLIYAGTRIGDRFETGHFTIIREHNRIGSDVQVWSHTTVDYGCRIGNRVKIHNHVYIAQYTVIEDDVFLAPGTMIANDRYPPSKNLVGPTIRKGARVGINATILPGVEIGAGALIGAGTVVVRDVPAGAVVVGNPSRVLRIRRKRTRSPS